MGAGLPASMAARLANGTCVARASDYDDANSNHEWDHPSVAVLGAAAGAGRETAADDSGRDMIVRDLVAGYEAECQVARSGGPGRRTSGVSHANPGNHRHVRRRRGGASRLRGGGGDRPSTPTTTTDALGIAAHPRAAGMKSMFAPWQAAARRQGGRETGCWPASAWPSPRLSPPHRARIDGRTGLSPRISGAATLWACGAHPGKWVSSGPTSSKYHAACFATHSTIEGVKRRLRARSGFGRRRRRRVRRWQRQRRPVADVRDLPDPRTGSGGESSRCDHHRRDDIDRVWTTSKHGDVSHRRRLRAPIRYWTRCGQRVHVEPDGPTDEGHAGRHRAGRRSRTVSIAHDVGVPATHEPGRAAGSACGPSFDAAQPLRCAPAAGRPVWANSVPGTSN
jgi:hypothetical protein